MAKAVIRDPAANHHVFYILSTAEGAGKGGDQQEEMPAFCALAPPTLVNEVLYRWQLGRVGAMPSRGSPGGCPILALRKTRAPKPLSPICRPLPASLFTPESELSA